ncbi:MAG: PSD1 and planctomycete cytochrome C domain-containing protein [Pirellulales bacterium]
MIASFDSSAAEPPNFSRDVRAILSDKCFQCHGPDEAKRQGGLRLDVRESALDKGDSGKHAIVAGKADESELIRRLVTSDADSHMPPAETKKVLTKEEVETLRRWIDAGAKYEGHWAFSTVVRPDVPQPFVADDSNAKEWLKHPIDRFLLARLQKEGLKPNSEADRETLIRRVALDLTGLPPKPDELRSFLAEPPSAAAYEKVGDHYLASPHYGERMALNWLDMARYADSNGFQSDGSRDIWAWRDWLIQAYNDNKPFDEFTIEQLAGDMLPDATTSQIIATGFNRNHRLNGEGGRIVEEWFAETVIDRVETTGLTWLGLTLNCTRCHDHKYDPLTQKEFYQLFAFFNSVEEQGVLAPEGKNGENTPPLLKLKTDEHAREVARRRQEIESLKKQLESDRLTVPALVAKWAEQQSKNTESASRNAWSSTDPSKVESLEGATLTKQDDGSYLSSGTNPANDIYRIRIPIDGERFSGFMIEVFPDASLPNQSLGRAFNGNFVLTDVHAEIDPPKSKKPKKVMFERADADFAQADWPVSDVLANKQLNLNKKPAPNRKGWAVEGNNTERRLPRKAIFVLKESEAVSPKSELVLTLGHFSQYANHNVGRFRILISGAAPATLSLEGAGIPSNVRSVLAKSSQDWSAEDRAAVEKYFLAAEPNPVRETQKKIDDAVKGLADYEADLPTTMVMKEAAKPRDAFVLYRGEYDKPRDKVSRGVPAVLPPLPEGVPNNRLGFAKWMVHRSNPLTARVWVNREWERFFGYGIVKTTENLGSQSEYPIHRELLDWLAVEFMEPTELPAVHSKAARPWDMKAFQKFVLLSAAYRQSSHVTREQLERDPDNRLLSRASRFRLPGEVVRDCALAGSGLLSEKIGGPSSRPYMPEGVWDETSRYGNLRNYKADEGEGLYRRSLYTIWKRTAAPPTMLIFDAPNREVCTVKRSRTNTPLQALSLLNEVTFVEAAKQLAVRMTREGGESPEQRIAYGYQLSLGRAPREAEMQVLLKGLDEDMKRFLQDTDSAKKLLAVGKSKIEGPDDPNHSATLAAYTLAANVILNLDEFITRE